MACSDCQKSKSLQDLKEEIEKLKQRNLELQEAINKAILSRDNNFSKDTILKD